MQTQDARCRKRLRRIGNGASQNRKGVFFFQHEDLVSCAPRVLFSPLSSRRERMGAGGIDTVELEKQELVAKNAFDKVLRCWLLR